MHIGPTCHSTSLSSLDSSPHTAPPSNTMILRRPLTDSTPFTSFLFFFPPLAIKKMIRTLKPRKQKNPPPDGKTAYDLRRRAPTATKKRTRTLLTTTPHS